MILLSKKENELNEEEKLKIEIMKTIAAAKGYDVESKTVNIDFRSGSAFEKASRFLLAKFDIKLKKQFLKNEENVVEEVESEVIKKPGRKKKEN